MFFIPGCFLQYQDTFLIIKKHPEVAFAGATWTLPAGKQDTGETVEETIIREIREETGYIIESQQLQFLGYLDCEHNRGPFRYLSYRADVPIQFTPVLSPTEHTEFRWVTGAECRTLPLIPDFHDILDISGY